jgi:WD40 repeat protein
MDEEPYQRSLSPFHDSCQHSFGPYAIYRKNRDVRIYSWLTGELLSEFEGPYDYFQIDDLSRDGRACLLHERYPFGGLGGIQALLDTSNGSKSLRDDRDRMITALSPDGRCIARYGTRDRSTWLEKLLLGKQRHTFVVENWITGEQLARFEGAEHVCFSPQGDYFAVQREDNVIDIYDLRFPTPWGQIAGAAALAGGLTWTIGWLWSRWRSRKQAPAISPAPDTRPH